MACARRSPGATPDSGEVKQGAKRAAGVAQENPLGLAIGATAFGFLVGMLVPSTKIEDERIGPMADEIKEKARRPARKQWSAARRVAQQAAESAKETAKEAGQEHAQGLRDSTQEKVSSQA